MSFLKEQPIYIGQSSDIVLGLVVSGIKSKTGDVQAAYLFAAKGIK